MGEVTQGALPSASSTLRPCRRNRRQRVAGLIGMACVLGTAAVVILVMVAILLPVM